MSIVGEDKHLADTIPDVHTPCIICQFCEGDCILAETYVAIFEGDVSVICKECKEANVKNPKLPHPDGFYRIDMNSFEKYDDSNKKPRVDDATPVEPKPVFPITEKE